jgi:hypothetical protein
MPARSFSSSNGWRTAVGFDQARQHQFGRLERRETFAAGQAFTPAAHLFALGDQTRVDDLGVVGTAEGTVHGGWQQKKGGPW